jgi:hypothetical protein
LLLNISRCGFLEEVGDHGSSHDLPSAPLSAALFSSFLKCDSSWSKPELLWSIAWAERDSESLRFTEKLVSMKRCELQTKHMAVDPGLAFAETVQLWLLNCQNCGSWACAAARRWCGPRPTRPRPNRRVVAAHQGPTAGKPRPAPIPTNPLKCEMTNHCN